jgi:hypothetical protein
MSTKEQHVISKDKERNDQTTTRLFIVVRLQGLFFLALHPRPEFPTREL